MKKIVRTISYLIFPILLIASCSIVEKAKRIKQYSKSGRAQFRLSQIRTHNVRTSDESFSSEVFSFIYKGSSESQNTPSSGMIIERRGDAIYISTFVD